MTLFMPEEWGKGEITNLSQGHTASKLSVVSSTRLVFCWSCGCADYVGEQAAGLMDKLGQGLCISRCFLCWVNYSRGGSQGFQKVRPFLLLLCLKNVLFCSGLTVFLREGVSRNSHCLMLEANWNPIPSQVELWRKICCPKWKIHSR